MVRTRSLLFMSHICGHNVVADLMYLEQTSANNQVSTVQTRNTQGKDEVFHIMKSFFSTKPQKSLLSDENTTGVSYLALKTCEV